MNLGARLQVLNPVNSGISGYLQHPCGDLRVIGFTIYQLSFWVASKLKKARQFFFSVQ
jgi:hypothetical protein